MVHACLLDLHPCRSFANFVLMKKIVLLVIFLLGALLVQAQIVTSPHSIKVVAAQTPYRR